MSATGLWACVTPERYVKTYRLMHALSYGWPWGQMCIGEPPPDMRPFAVWGQEWLSLRTLPGAAASGRPFFHLDNGYYKPARGSALGYYRVCYRSMTPIALRAPDTVRGQTLGAGEMKPWRRRGRHILLALPGQTFGKALGMQPEMEAWFAAIRRRVSKYSNRVVLVREKSCTRPLEYDLDNCWAVVTHSSNVAVDAVRAGVPVFCAPTNPAAPVGCTDLSRLEVPVYPAREAWWASLMCQQFTLNEMRDGTAYRYLKLVCRQVDEQRPAPMRA